MGNKKNNKFKTSPVISSCPGCDRSWFNVSKDGQAEQKPCIICLGKPEMERRAAEFKAHENEPDLKHIELERLLPPDPIPDKT